MTLLEEDFRKQQENKGRNNKGQHTTYNPVKVLPGGIGSLALSDKMKTALMTSQSFTDAEATTFMVT